MRSRALRLVGLIVVAGVTITAVAGAAASPTVTTGGATKVTTSTVVLNGRVNPSGSRTSWVFSFGPTPLLGATTPARPAGAGTKAVAVAKKIIGLTPGTVYYYRLTASNRSGTATGAERKFKTAGHPPAAVVTGPAANVGKTTATPTGIINPEGAATTWVIQYGVTPGYGFETFPQTLGPAVTPVPIAAELTGIAPRTLFHYRVVAYHGATVVSAGADATFFTEPSLRPRPRLIAHTRPGRARRSPYQFTTSGSLKGAPWIPAAQRCVGNVGVRFFNGRHQLAFVVTPVGPDCRFAAAAAFRRLHGPKPAFLHVTVDYRGTGYMAPANRVDHVVAG